MLSELPEQTHLGPVFAHLQLTSAPKTYLGDLGERAHTVDRSSCTSILATLLIPEG